MTVMVARQGQKLVEGWAYTRERVADRDKGHTGMVRSTRSHDYRRDRVPGNRADLLIASLISDRLSNE